MTTPLVSFIIPVRNDAERLRQCLLSIAPPPDVPIEILVADNGSTDPSPDVARAAGAQVLSLPNRPVSRVRNEAAKAARGEFLALVDADHTLGPEWTRHAVACMANPAVWAVGAEYQTPASGTWVQRMYDRFRSHQPGDVPVEWLPSGNLLVRRSAFEQVGGFDESLESCEDVDFCRKIRLGGGVLLSSADLSSVHHGDPRTLANLFFAELWRGRDNLRVSLRDRFTFRSAPSLVIPILNVGALALVVAGLALAPWGYGRLAIAGFAVFVSFGLLRAVRLLTNPGTDGHRIGDAGRAMLVAMTYDLARALALVLRASHATRRKAEA